MSFRYTGHEIELHGLMDGVEDIKLHDLMMDGMEDIKLHGFTDGVENAIMPRSLSPSSMPLLKVALPKTGLFNYIRREVRLEPDLAAMLDGIQKGDHGNPWEVIDGIMLYNHCLYLSLWSPILPHILDGVDQLGGCTLLDEIAIGIYKPSSSPFSRSFPAPILLPQTIPHRSIQTCNVLADYVVTEFLHVSVVI
jgi:hypothetical protein